MAIVRGAQLGHLRGRRRGLGQWKRYTEQVVERMGTGRYTIYLREQPGYPLPDGLGAITSQEGGLLSTGAGIATTATVSSVAAGTALGSWAGPIGAGVGALVGIIAGLFAASAARAKGATEENDAVNEYLPAWDQGMQEIFQAANAGTITGADAASLVPSLMSSWWQAAAQFHGLPGVSDNSGGGASCGSYTSGVTTRCSPGHPCGKSCTAFCCVGCNDLWPSSLDAIAILSSASGGVLNTCTVYGSGYGATQRSGYSLTYTPPKTTAATTTASGVTVTGTAAAATPTILGLPWYVALGAAALAAYEFL
jgi:hypothetical protein